MMGNNEEQMVINLMQNLVDKIDEISDEIKSRDDKIQTLISEYYKLQTNKIIENLKLNAKLYRERNTELSNTLLDKLEDQKPTSTINNYKHYSLLGEKSIFRPKQILLILFGLTFLWGTLKYGPKYYLDQSQLKRDNEDYQLFYNWIFLNQFKNNENIDADDILQDIKARDSLLMKKYKILLIEYENEIKRKELRKKLDSLTK